MKASTPNGQLPICTLEDGTVIPESGAIMRACAAQTGLLGKGKDFVISEMLIGMTGDLVKSTFGSGKVPSAFTLDAFKEEAAVKEFNETTKPAAIAQVAKYDKWLLPSGDKFTESGTTVGEIDYFCKLYMLKAALPELAEGKMKPFFARMSELPGIKKVLEGGSKMGPLADYLVAMH
jgi:glutathione S-transferase